MSLQEHFAIPASPPAFSPSIVTPDFQPFSVPKSPDPWEVLNNFEQMLSSAGSNVFLREYEGKAEFPPKAVYTSFKFPPVKPGEVGFINEISLHSVEDSAQEFIARAHEGIHAGQWAKSAPLHAIHMNAQSAYIMSPRDWVRAMLVTEAEAFAKTAFVAWASATAHGDDSFYHQTMQKDPVSTTEIYNALRNNADTTKALSDLAVKAMRKTHHIGANRHEVSFFEYYTSLALSEYKDSFRLNKPHLSAKFPYEFVTLSTDDKAQIGCSFASDIAVSLFDHMEEMIVRDQNLNLKIDALNEKFGIVEQKLRSLEHALHAANVTPKKFIERSKLPHDAGIASGHSFGSPNVVHCLA